MMLADPAWYMEVTPGAYAPLGQSLTGYEPETKEQLLRCRGLDGRDTAYRLPAERSCDVGPLFAHGQEDPVLEKLRHLLQGRLLADGLKTSVVAAWPEGALRREAYIELLGKTRDGISFRLHFTGVEEEGSFDKAAGRFLPGGRMGLRL